MLCDQCEPPVGFQKVSGNEIFPCGEGMTRRPGWTDGGGGATWLRCSQGCFQVISGQGSLEKKNQQSMFVHLRFSW